MSRSNCSIAPKRVRQSITSTEWRLVVNREPRRFLNFVVLSVGLPVGELLNVAAFEEALFISPAFAPALSRRAKRADNSRQLTPDGTQPAAPGYLDWLRSKGLAARPDFIIDFTDTGLDRGSTSEGFVHPDFLDPEGRSRVVYNMNYARDASEDRGGHGTLVASVAVGLGSSRVQRRDGPHARHGRRSDNRIRRVADI